MGLTADRLILLTALIHCLQHSIVAMTNDLPRELIQNVFQEGPYLQTACLCELVLEDKDGVKSAIRIVDRIIKTAAGPEAPEQMGPFDHPLSLLLKFKTGNNPGKHVVSIHLVNPRNEEAPPLTQSFIFEPGEERGVDIVANLRMKLQFEGVYWVDIYLDEIRITRIPFRVIYVMQRHGKAAPQQPVQ